ncbi:uncharacterized protein LOC113272579 [Papaver somniferum]|uniref:uncharacterized protein LOC113272579 n=1 Tax=Papaver somniferum TaxID=3469 RepID=UPI000E6F5F3A|nr:uncharacterized protein LOC113272579 [Papaver somniferum]
MVESPPSSPSKVRGPKFDEPHSSLDPYDVPASDNPSTVLYSPILTGDNYPTWSRGIARVLRAKNKYGFVDGTIAKPIASDDTLPAWIRANNLVCTWIANSCEAEIKRSISWIENARDIWIDLEDRFSETNMPRIFDLKRHISTLKQEDSSISSYYTKLKSLWDEVGALTPVEPCTCGNGRKVLEQLNRDKAMEFLQGLHDRFSAVRSNILLMSPFPTLAKIYSLVRQEEQQQFINVAAAPQIDKAALSTRFASRPSPWSNTNGPSNKKPRPSCDHCRKIGHTKDRCYQLVGYPKKPGDDTSTGYAGNSISLAPSSYMAAAPQLTHDQYNQLLALLQTGPITTTANLAGLTNEEADWSG